IDRIAVVERIVLIGGDRAIALDSIADPLGVALAGQAQRIAEFEHMQGAGRDLGRLERRELLAHEDLDIGGLRRGVGHDDPEWLLLGRGSERDLPGVGQVGRPEFAALARVVGRRLLAGRALAGALLVTGLHHALGGAHVEQRIAVAGGARIAVAVTGLIAQGHGPVAAGATATAPEGERERNDQPSQAAMHRSYRRAAPRRCQAGSGPRLAALPTMAKTRNHGPQIKDDERYEALRREGMSKEKAARIANTPRELAARRGGRSPKYEEWTKADLYDKARQVGIEGRSSMNKEQLIDALRNH